MQINLKNSVNGLGLYLIQNSQLESGESVKFIEKTRPVLALDPQHSPPVSPNGETGGFGETGGSS